MIPEEKGPPVTQILQDHEATPAVAGAAMAAAGFRYYIRAM